jgi:hypothetical protein
MTFRKKRHFRHLAILLVDSWLRISKAVIPEPSLDLRFTDGFLNRQSKVVEARKLLPIVHLCEHSQAAGAD